MECVLVVGPVIFGAYPEEGVKKYEAYLPKITDADMKLISEPIDIYGQNIYNGHCVRMGQDREAGGGRSVPPAHRLPLWTGL